MLDPNYLIQYLTFLTEIIPVILQGIEKETVCYTKRTWYIQGIFAIVRIPVKWTKQPVYLQKGWFKLTGISFHLSTPTSLK